ncbi:hypothetical protein Q8X48_18655 [Pseudomonas sp. QLc11A]|jgi:hypothetical protein|uniref:Uncharacterized protein n=1 Tax=Pseudomonas azerbaijanorientalis TaxID=2842350 RepID=A0ABW8WBV7_9PSED
MNSDVEELTMVHPSQEKESFFIQTVVWRQMADELIEINPAARYVDVRDKVDKELDAVFHQYYGRLDKYLEERAEDFRNALPPLS